MKLSTAATRCMRSIRDHSDAYYDCKGRSEYGGREGTVRALRNAGYVSYDAAADVHELTAEGRTALDRVLGAPPL